MSPAPSELPIVSPYALALPALQVKVTVEEVKVDPGSGVNITAGPVGGGVGVGVGVGTGVGVGVAVGGGVGVGVGGGVGVGVAVGVGLGAGAVIERATCRFSPS